MIPSFYSTQASDPYGKLPSEHQTTNVIPHRMRRIMAPMRRMNKIILYFDILAREVPQKRCSSLLVPSSLKVNKVIEMISIANVSY